MMCAFDSFDRLGGMGFPGEMMSPRKSTDGKQPENAITQIELAKEGRPYAGQVQSEVPTWQF